MKVCSKCKIEKSLDEFRKNKAAKDGLSYYCIICSREYYKKLYNDKTKPPRQKHIDDVSKRNTKNRNWFKCYKKTLFCKQCGNSDYRVLDFHHITDDKEFNVSEGTTLGTWRLFGEVEKCDVLCANCHRIKTSEDREINKQ